ncbi:hypothetical protein SAMN02745121_00011 [Nannocystis exedens]|uniref:Uncharacterized protein n=1 Tax=Nannocystis exedens TaxID=54 RepID=A0A1I1SG03_9BACT|nr:hypothetical protein [Nannocystis exedens]PCC75472.1 hypothetical protein NAEX_08582 [Nannocystis exedens]SFD45415.1 hypothetical protein SAMN02745121_00011 [Nannocystis exedens]
MTAATRAEPRAAAPERILSLDRLAALSSDALRGLYARGAVPDDLTVLDGRPKGRMLAVRGLEHGPVGRFLRAFAGHPRFPWDGKSFSPERDDEGRGINRVDLLVRRFEWFPFVTRIEPSVVDGQPCVYLDYEQPGNPWFIARIRDELREVAPGLYLGPAMWKRADGGATHVLWFAVDFSTPSDF